MTEPSSSPPPAADAATPSKKTTSLVASLSGLWRAILEGLQARADLVALDIQRAGLSLAQMLVLVFLCVFLLWTSWFALMVGAVLVFSHMGASMAWGIAMVVVANLLLARLLWHRIAHLTHYLTLPDVRAHLTSRNHG